jgi:hypothetical protein
MDREKDMKIAFCYSGAVRYCEEVYTHNHKILFDALDEAKIEYDIFWHAWEPNNELDKHNIYSDSRDLQLLLERVYNPKSIIIENIEKYNHIHPKYFGQHISISRCIELANTHGNYDIKFKIRSDAVMRNLDTKRLIKLFNEIVDGRTLYPFNVIYTSALYYDFYQGNMGDYFLFSKSDIMDKWLTIKNVQYVIDNYHTDKDIRQAVNTDSQNRVFLFMLKSAFVDEEQYNNPYFFMPFMNKDAVRIHTNGCFWEFLYRETMTVDDILPENIHIGHRKFLEHVPTATAQKEAKGRFRRGDEFLF